MVRDRDQVIYIAGHRGMVGSALVRRLTPLGYTNLLTANHAELDLLDQAAVNDFFARQPIDQVYLAAARVGGIHANNTYPADFIYQNLMIEANLIHAAHQHGVQKLLFLGSSCIYPQLAAQPMAEEALLTGPLEPTNEPYAIAKIAGIKLLVFDPSRPDGTPRKLLDVSRLKALGWEAGIGLEAGLRDAYGWYRASLAGNAGP